MYFTMITYTLYYGFRTARHTDLDPWSSSLLHSASA